MAYENSVYEYNENGELCVRVTGTGGGGGGAVSSVNGKTGAVVLDANDIGVIQQYSTMPMPSRLGESAQYVGATKGEYNNGCFYKSVKGDPVVESGNMNVDYSTIDPAPSVAFDKEVFESFLQQQGLPGINYGYVTVFASISDGDKRVVIYYNNGLSATYGLSSGATWADCESALQSMGFTVDLSGVASGYLQAQIAGTLPTVPSGVFVWKQQGDKMVQYESDSDSYSAMKMDDSGWFRRTYDTGGTVEAYVNEYVGSDPNATYDPQVGGMVFEIANEETFSNYIASYIAEPAGIVKNVPKTLRVVLTNTDGEEYPYSIYFYDENDNLLYEENLMYNDEFLESDVGLMWNPTVGSGDYPILSATSTGFVITTELKDVKEIQTETVGVLAPSPEGLSDADLVIRSGMVQWGAPTIKSIETTTAILRQYNWSNNTQVANIWNVKIDSNSIVIVSPTPNTQTTYTSAGIKCVNQGMGNLTFQCDEQPDNDVTVNILSINRG